MLKPTFRFYIRLISTHCHYNGLDYFSGFHGLLVHAGIFDPICQREDMHNGEVHDRYEPDRMNSSVWMSVNPGC